MSSTKDIQLYDDGTGGDFLVVNSDLSISETLFQTVYLALFGGNREASTLGNEVDGQERFDYWANKLLFDNVKNKQFNSETEKTINSVALNSEGRAKIEEAVKKDLQYLSDVANLEISVFLDSLDRVDIRIRETEISNSLNRVYQFVWDNAKEELIVNMEI